MVCAVAKESFTTPFVFPDGFKIFGAVSFLQKYDVMILFV